VIGLEGGAPFGPDDGEPVGADEHLTDDTGHGVSTSLLTDRVVRGIRYEERGERNGSRGQCPRARRPPCAGQAPRCLTGPRPGGPITVAAGRPAGTLSRGHDAVQRAPRGSGL